MQVPVLFTQSVLAAPSASARLPLFLSSAAIIRKQPGRQYYFRQKPPRSRCCLPPCIALSMYGLSNLPKSRVISAPVVQTHNKVPKHLARVVAKVDRGQDKTGSHIAHCNSTNLHRSPYTFTPPIGQPSDSLKCSYIQQCGEQALLLRTCWAKQHAIVMPGRRSAPQCARGRSHKMHTSS